MSTAVDVEQTKKEWLERLAKLVGQIRSWAEKLDWSTREIEKSLSDSVLGKHRVPALLLQKETTRILLEPITRQAPGADGVVDLYMMPAYDDIASLYFADNAWQLQFAFPEIGTDATTGEAESLPLTRESFKRVVEEMVKDAI